MFAVVICTHMQSCGTAAVYDFIVSSQLCLPAHNSAHTAVCTSQGFFFNAQMKLQGCSMKKWMPSQM